jgi:hypothetical protein
MRIRVGDALFSPSGMKFLVEAVDAGDVTCRFAETKSKSIAYFSLDYVKQVMSHRPAFSVGDIVRARVRIGDSLSGTLGRIISELEHVEQSAEDVPQEQEEVVSLLLPRKRPIAVEGVRPR